MDAKPLNISIVAGRVSHPEAVFDDLASRAQDAVDPAEWQVCLTIVHVDDGSSVRERDVPGAKMVPLAAAGNGPVAPLFQTIAGKPGLVGVLGRLVRDNLESRTVAKSVVRRNDLLGVFQSSAVVVSADPSADRLVWGLRRKTGAHLVHGPIAMLHAINVLTKG